ncbi:MAG: amidase [Acetobacteraceae bacterium]
MPADIASLDAVSLANAIREGAVSPLEAVDAALARIEAHPGVNPFITVCAESARAEALRASKRLRDAEPPPPLLGVPFSAKDLLLTAGVRTTFGSRLLANQVPEEDAVAVARLKAAGAILIGKTTTPEFGHKAFTDAPLFGRTLNPWDESVTCGGSSGGAAVAVLLGMGPLALGTDGGGSIRIPASCCGVVGLKATPGAIPHLQVPDLFGANSFVGPMARTVAEVQLAFAALRGPDARDPYGQAVPPPSRERPLKGLRIAFLPRAGGPVAAEVAGLTAAAVQQLAALGAVVEEISLDLALLEPAFLTILESALAARLASFLPLRRADLDPTLVLSVEKGLTHDAVALQRAQAERSAMFRRLQALFERHALLTSPVLTRPALPLGTDPHGTIEIDGREAGTIRGAWYPFTFPLNLTGHPALAMPCGFTSGGLPVGLQIAGPWHSEPTILTAARALEDSLALPRRPQSIARSARNQAGVSDAA